MNQNTVSGDIVDLKLSQLGATQITKLRSHMYIVDFALENGIEISYVFNITKHDKYFLQRMRPYAMVQGKYADTKEITKFIKEDLRRFRTAEHSSNFEEFVDSYVSSYNIADRDTFYKEYGGEDYIRLSYAENQALSKIMESVKTKVADNTDASDDADSSADAE